jgi:hypothetical protein
MLAVTSSARASSSSSTSSAEATRAAKSEGPSFSAASSFNRLLSTGSLSKRLPFGAAPPTESWSQSASR